jgi:hypothetical protein
VNTTSNLLGCAGGSSTRSASTRRIRTAFGSAAIASSFGQRRRELGQGRIRTRSHPSQYAHVEPAQTAATPYPIHFRFRLPRRLQATRGTWDNGTV